MLEGGGAPWPLVQTVPAANCSTTSTTVGANTVVSALSVIVWKHINATYAVHWTVPNGIWRRAHTNRVDVSPGKFPAATYNQPLNRMSGGGGGKFWNFYQEYGA
jgi:hypothetical protein